MSQVSQKVIDAFGQTTVEVMQGFMTETSPKAPLFEQEVRGDISSFIKLTESERNAIITLVLYFPEGVARTIYGKLFGEGTGGIQDICNLIAELANIIAGNVKEKISGLHEEILSLVHPGSPDLAKDGRKLNFEIDIPTTVVGSGHMVIGPKKGDVYKLAIPFSGSPDPLFYLELTFRKKTP